MPSPFIEMSMIDIILGFEVNSMILTNYTQM